MTGWNWLASLKVAIHVKPWAPYTNPKRLVIHKSLACEYLYTWALAFESSQARLVKCCNLHVCVCAIVEQWAIWPSSRCSSRHFFTNIILTCLWSFNLSFLNSWKPICFTVPFLRTMYSRELSQNYYLGIDHASFVFYSTCCREWMVINLFNIFMLSKFPFSYCYLSPHLRSSRVLVFATSCHFYGGNVLNIANVIY